VHQRITLLSTAGVFAAAIHRPLLFGGARVAFRQAAAPDYQSRTEVSAY